MTKQEFLAFSLPYGLQGTVKGKSNISGEFIYTLHNVPNKCATVEVVGESNFYTDIDKFRPILHPLSNLTKEIEHNGEKFVPIARIYNMSGHYEIGRNWFKQNNIECLPFFIMQFLVKNHFDIADLISKGEAIDVNILDINPYK